MKGIPIDQRSIRTVAKVEGLVGKAVAIDEKTRLKIEAVRVKITCRDVAQVPAVAVGSLGVCLYGFLFEEKWLMKHKEKKTRKAPRLITMQTSLVQREPKWENIAYLKQNIKHLKGVVASFNLEGR
jgi:hypothetical protein